MPQPSEPFNAAAHLVDRHVEQGRGGRTAIVSEGRVLSYSDVREAANRFGNALLRLGVAPGHRVALCLLDGPEFVAAFLGAIKIGAVAVPTNTLLTPQELAFILSDCDARVLVASEALMETVARARAGRPGLAHLIVAGRRLEGCLAWDDVMDQGPEHFKPAATRAEDPAFWLYTSGTTGAPKAAVHRHRDMRACCEAFGRHLLEIGPDDRCYSVAKLFFAYGLGNSLYYPFGVGATSILGSARFEPAAVLELVALERPTLFFAVPSAYAALLRAIESGAAADFSSVRMCLSAGEALPEPLYRRWQRATGLELLDGIGSTELCNTFICNRPGRVRPGSSGTVVPGYQVRVVDERDRDVPDGTAGHLVVKGDSAFAGYWNQPEKTRRAFLGEFVRTGDRYVRDPDGYFWYQGRADEMIKVSGMWVAPAEVEQALLGHPAVREVGVAGAEDADGLIKPKAFVVLADGHRASGELEQALKDLVKATLAPYKYPRWVEFVDALPRTATGKLQRFKLRGAS